MNHDDNEQTAANTSSMPCYNHGHTTIAPHFHRQHINISTRVYHPLSTLLLRLEDEQNSRCIASQAIGMLFILFFYTKS